MNDTLTIKALDDSTLDSANFPGTAITFPRVQSSGNQYLRKSIVDGSLSPTKIRVAHTARSARNSIQRSLFAVDQDFGRLDSESNLIRTDKLSVKFQADIPEGVTEAEFLVAAHRLLGALLETTSANLKSVYNGET